MTTNYKDIPRRFDFEAIVSSSSRGARQYNEVVLVGRYSDFLSAGQELLEVE